MDKIRNGYIRGKLSKKLRSNGLAWYGYVMRRDKSCDKKSKV